MCTGVQLLSACNSEISSKGVHAEVAWAICTRIIESSHHLTISSSQLHHLCFTALCSLLSALCSLPLDYILTRTTNEEILLRGLNVPGVTFAAFLIQDFLPTLNQHKRSVEARDAILRAMLLNFTVLARDEPSLRQVLQDTPFVPTGHADGGGGHPSSTRTTTITTNHRLARCNQVYDPDNEELRPILNPEHVPASSSSMWRDASILAVLRQLGLRRVLDRSTVVDIVRDIERHNDTGRAALL